MKSKIFISLCALLFVLGACSDKELKNNNNNNGANNSYQYVEITIDGTTYKYEKIDGNSTKNANGEETFPLVVWTDSAFKVSGGCNSNGFDFVYPITVSGTGSFSLPAVNLFTSAKHFEAVFFKDNLATVYNHDYSTRKLNTGICNFVTRSTTPQTLSITTWGPLGFANSVENCEGSFSGTLYENDQSDKNCANSSAHPYSGTFKYYTK